MKWADERGREQRAQSGGWRVKGEQKRAILGEREVKRLGKKARSDFVLTMESSMRSIVPSTALSSLGSIAEGANQCQCWQSRSRSRQEPSRMDCQSIEKQAASDDGES